MIFILTFDLPVLCLCTSVESETLWTGELGSSLTRYCVERPSVHSAALLRPTLCRSIPEQEDHTMCPSLLLKEIQAASSLRASFLNLPNPSSSHYRNTWVEPLLSMKLLCLRVNWPSATEQVFWDSLRTCSFEDAWEKRLGDSGGLVGCKKAMPCEANTRELIGIY